MSSRLFPAALAICLASVGLQGVVTPAAVAADDFDFTGGGNGHGVGMSQYGAYGQALETPSKPGSEIAEHYYSGTEVQPLSALSLDPDTLETVPDAFWVNLKTKVTSFDFSANGGPLELCLANDGSGPCPSALTPQPGESWSFQEVGAGCQFFRNGIAQGNPGDCRASIDWQPGATLTLDGRDYRYGGVKVRSANVSIGFHVSLALDLEKYLLGVFELLPEWQQPGVNEAQAIASRSYAAYRYLQYEHPELRTAEDAGFSTARKAACWCHIFGGSSDQTYRGVEFEDQSPAYVTAVEATAGDVLTYFEPGYSSFTKQGVVQAFFYTSSGGVTESNRDGFGSSIQWPYLVPVDDHWSADPAVNPAYATWERTVASATIASRLGWDSVSSATLLNLPPGATVRFEGTDNGQTVSIEKRGIWFRSTLGLPSMHIRAIDGVAPDPPPPPVGPFDDIAGSTHEAAIIAIFEAGYTQGCDADSFCPAMKVTRDQMASFIARAMELPSASFDFFTDDTGNVHEDNINAIAAAEVTVGCGPGLYCPRDPVTRDQMATFLTRALQLPGVATDYFTDDDGSIHEPNINAVAAQAITLGCASGLYCPHAEITREQMASFLFRAFLGG